MTQVAPTGSGTGDFDFLVGSWEVRNRRLEKPLTGSDQWDEFPATTECRSLFGGAANLDEITFPTKGFTALTLRLYEPASRTWSLNWVNGRDGRLTPPVSGRFAADGNGEFYGIDILDDGPVRCRFIWSNITATSARWEQAYSVEGDDDWETNWIMDFSR